MLSPELIKKVDQLFIRARRKVTDVFAGEFESAFRGRGIEFEEFREYVPGDDIRQISWNVTARMDKPFVKVFREEREQTVFFLIDLSASQDFGAGRTKRDIVTEIAALLAYTAIRTNDKVGLVLFTDRIEAYVPPKKGRAHVWHIIATILTHKPASRGTDVTQALKFFMTVCPRRVTCFLMSDFWDEGYGSGLAIAAVKHDIVVLRVSDAIERAVPPSALMDFSDNESGARVTVDLKARANRIALSGRLQARENEMSRFFRAKGIGELSLRVDGDYVDALLEFFLSREKRK
jgi:uncharacterized protein (DUF58 family)